MKFEEIKKLVEKNEITKFFKEAYKHSINVLESIPDERIKEMLDFKTNSYVDSAPYGVVNSFIFSNGLKDEEDEALKSDIDKVIVNVEFAYFSGGESLDANVEMLSEEVVEKEFDYRGFSVSISISENKVEFYENTLIEELSKEEETFMETAKMAEILNAVFGEYLCGCSEVGICVSKDFFK